MEEDIKILEEFYTKGYSMMYIEYGGRIKANSKIERALENLIKGYREIEEENARLGMLNLVQEDMIKVLEEKLMYALSPTSHELAITTQENFKKIIIENMEKDTYTIKRLLKEYWEDK